MHEHNAGRNRTTIYWQGSSPSAQFADSPCRRPQWHWRVGPRGLGVSCGLWHCWWPWSSGTHEGTCRAAGICKVILSFRKFRLPIAWLSESQWCLADSTFWKRGSWEVAEAFLGYLMWSRHDRIFVLIWSHYPMNNSVFLWIKFIHLLGI